MDPREFDTHIPVRSDGWSEALKVRFLDHLAAKGTVSAACALVGMSREAAYRMRRRDRLFARAWAAALLLARENAEDILACRAIDGIEEQIWYRGELVGVRHRHDSRLLLAHLARLDRLVELEEEPEEDAARFDTLLAMIGGAEMPEALVCDSDGLPLERASFVAEAAESAEREERYAQYDLEEQAAAAAEEDDDADPLDWEALADANTDRQFLADEACREAYERGAAEAEAQWDAWHALACGHVDGLLVRPAGPGADAASLPWTVSTLSTSAPVALPRVRDIGPET